jgi:hypothetical protein
MQSAERRARARFYPMGRRCARRCRDAQQNLRDVRKPRKNREKKSAKPEFSTFVGAPFGHPNAQQHDGA